jgi:hypothetical protein
VKLSFAKIRPAVHIRQATLSTLLGIKGTLNYGTSHRYVATHR